MGSPAIAVLAEGAPERTLVVDGELLVGRAKDCGLSIADQRLSRHHARLFVEAGRLHLEDLGGPNGTTVNDRAVKGRVALSPGDVIVLGKSRITVLTEAGSASKRLVRQATDVGHTPELVKPVAQRSWDLAVLHEVSRAVQRESDAESMLQGVLAIVLEVTSCERGFAALLDDSGELVLQAMGTMKSGDTGVVLSHTVAEHVLDQGLAVICSDASADERFRDAASLMLSDTRSLMAVPILVQNRVLGLIQIESSHLARRFEEKDLDLLSVVASTVGVALENLRLLEARAKTIRELEAAQAALLATQERLVRTEQLAAIGRLAAGIAHEVKNHLSPFALASMIAKKHPDDRQLQDAAEMMHEAQQHILDLVNQVRAFASGAESSRERAPHDVTEVVEGVLAFLRYDPALKRVPMALEAAEHPVANLDPRSFRQVLINLLRNAADALGDGDGRITVRVFAEVDRVIVEVEDEGAGIPEEVAARIFEPFFTTKGERGLGLGLDISQKIVADHGGRLTFESELGVGTTFRIELPAWTDEDETEPPG